ncbi:bifunctional adenosylcobinamide kinase/adenosylcobinamide-phosphate guanylyltransferase [Steroidobacter sp.]|uniref:bifunctional adenosylcobinamide kinase/adenosylcobinamide-phosphate guanylyltransferase n=1 Tax=Steroidobacter sp. TaxID=1978227 RepID=UPI001A3FD45E|nr:bifunctional adenosylcobinamide kinase/adenosylcobinamide-phosphate guanylyltransferase [Steroidobacter sp.]MBL8270432.1 bifunctional adenosylcobinamide kinase/adenosylcobinamide-phosphate guanylyltransferase [Steroidobacter sp.]
MVEDAQAGERVSAGRHLVIGGARSGKTAHALELAKSLAAARGAAVTYVATAQALDPEMQHRISLHRAERPARWRTLEAPTDLAQAVRAESPTAILVIDCMTLWLSNALLQDFRDDAPTASLATWQTESDAFFQWLQAVRGDVVLITNEVGAGIVPLSSLSRRFQDEQGRLNQRLAALCDRVTLVVAGIALPIKPAGAHSLTR